MLLYDIMGDYDSLPEKFKEENLDGYANFIACPHYYITALRLAAIAKSLNTDLKKLKYTDINLPHDSLILTVKDDDQDTVDEVVLNLKDLRTHIQITAFFRFVMSKSENIHIAGRMEPTPENDSGVNFSITDSNVIDFFQKEKVNGVENQLAQYIFNRISQFSVVINKSKDLREGIETRFIKTNKNAKGKKAYRDVTIIHLNSYKYLQKNKFSLNKNIIWNNSWIVRGHWRYLIDKTKLGKDRNDIRQEEGRTWIIPYQKQKELELKNNLRELRN